MVVDVPLVRVRDRVGFEVPAVVVPVGAHGPNVMYIAPSIPPPIENAAGTLPFF